MLTVNNAARSRFGATARRNGERDSTVLILRVNYVSIYVLLEIHVITNFPTLMLRLLTMTTSNVHHFRPNAESITNTHIMTAIATKSVRAFLCRHCRVALRQTMRKRHASTSTSPEIYDVVAVGGPVGLALLAALSKRIHFIYRSHKLITPNRVIARDVASQDSSHRDARSQEATPMEVATVLQPCEQPDTIIYRVSGIHRCVASR